ncbi:MAG: hypothetical protein K8J31_28945, partial [Anaerolineae bacterium]|nr:hypothetical protein [Anaerolineae bacterium]
VVALSLDGSNLANPATAVALANRPTATPDYAACPPPSSPTLSNTPSNGLQMADEITQFLSAGGSPAALETALRGDWGVMGEAGTVRAEFDLTGEGSADVVVTYSVPGEGGALLVLGCAAGRIIPFYQADTSSIPQIVHIGELNANGTPEILYSSQECLTETDCSYRSQVITWLPQEGRFASLLSGAIVSQNLPEIGDFDNDRVIEIILRMTSSGTPATGPLRTGVTIYDWNGVDYRRSITQLDPPRFRIQVVRQGDRNLAQNDVQEAIALYELSLRDDSLRNWFNDDSEILRSYTLYRLLTAYAFTENDSLLPAFQSIQQTYPDPLNAPIYAQMSNTFWTALQVTGNLRSACLEVQNQVRAQPEAIDLLTRYGGQGPVYTAESLCPF